MKELQTAVEKKQYPDSKIRKQNLLDALNKQYPGGDDTTKNLMAENLMNAMANFGCTDISHLNDTMVAELSQQFAAQWKENAVMNLKDRKLTGF